MNGVHFWDGNQGKVISFDHRVYLDKVPFELLGMHCVDTYCSDAQFRYGTYHILKVPNLRLWKSIPFDEFPAEFKVNLLLLSIS